VRSTPACPAARSDSTSPVGRVRRKRRSSAARRSQPLLKETSESCSDHPATSPSDSVLVPKQASHSWQALVLALAECRGGTPRKTRARLAALWLDRERAELVLQVGHRLVVMTRFPTVGDDHPMWPGKNACLLASSPFLSVERASRQALQLREALLGLRIVIARSLCLTGWRCRREVPHDGGPRTSTCREISAESWGQTVLPYVWRPNQRSISSRLYTGGRDSRCGRSPRGCPRIRNAVALFCSARVGQRLEPRS